MILLAHTIVLKQTAYELYYWHCQHFHLLSSSSALHSPAFGIYLVVLLLQTHRSIQLVVQLLSLLVFFIYGLAQELVHSFLYSIRYGLYLKLVLLVSLEVEIVLEIISFFEVVQTILWGSNSFVQVLAVEIVGYSHCQHQQLSFIML